MYEQDGGDYSPAVVGLWPQMVERVSVLLEAFKDLVAGVRDKKQLNPTHSTSTVVSAFWRVAYFTVDMMGGQCNIWSDSSGNLRYSNEAPV